MLYKKQQKAYGVIASILAAIIAGAYLTLKILSLIYHWLKELVSAHFGFILIVMIVALLIFQQLRFYLRIGKFVK